MATDGFRHKGLTYLQRSKLKKKCVNNGFKAGESVLIKTELYCLVKAGFKN